MPMDERIPAPELRASDADRERAADELREHYAAGRLTAEEFQERLDAAYAARTTADLARQLRDLPAQAPPAPRPSRRAALGGLAEQAAMSLAVFLVCVAVWALSGADSSFWPKWVAIFAVFRLTLVARHRLAQRDRRGGDDPEPLGPPPPSLPGR